MDKIYDFYSEFKPEDVKEICELGKGIGKFLEIKDIYSKIVLLATLLNDNDLKLYAQTGSVPKKLKNYENKAGLKHLIHDCATYNTYIKTQLDLIKNIGLKETFPETLPEASFLLSIKFRLKTPFLSADDEPFYIIENPVRKEKVFKVPMMSSSGWKGTLRWVMTKLFLVDNKDSLQEYAFTDERLRLSLLFGPEKGMQEKNSWAKFLDGLRTDAKENYRNRLKEWFGIQSNKPEPNFMGRLRFYPTFFNKMDLMVINPHDRMTKTGKNPVYIEYVPEEAEGNLSILYMPFDLIGRKAIKVQNEMKKDIDKISKGVREILYKYGFSAKKSSGFGTALPIKKDNIKVISKLDELRKIVIENLVETKNG